MKFNKSAESDIEFYYVGFDDDSYAGEIILVHKIVGNSTVSEFYFFAGDEMLNANQMYEISDKLGILNLRLSIDTTSTFTSNQDIK